MTAEHQKVHITLVGGQPYPIYVGLKVTSPDRVIMVCSKQSRKDADLIASVAGIDQSRLEVVMVDADDIKSSHDELLEHVVKRISPDCEYTVSLTGGPKPWSLFLYQFLFGKENVKLMYVDQASNICSLDSLSQMASGVELDMDILFRLKNAEAKEYLEFSSFTEEDFVVTSKMDALYSLNNRDLVKCFGIMTNPSRPHNRSELPSAIDYPPAELQGQRPLVEFNRMPDLFRGSFMKFEMKDGTGHADMICRSKGFHGFDESLSFKSPHLMDLLFFAGWFEVFTARMLSKWKGSREIRVGVRFDFANSEKIKNEIDVIVNTGGKLLFVECKTKIFNKTDLDKFSNVVKQYGGMGSKALFVSYFSIENDPDTEEKCKATGIIYFSIEDARKKWNPLGRFHMSGAELEEMNSFVQQEFNNLLDEKLKISNKM